MPPLHVIMAWHPILGGNASNLLSVELKVCDSESGSDKRYEQPYAGRTCDDTNKFTAWTLHHLHNGTHALLQGLLLQRTLISIRTDSWAYSRKAGVRELFQRHPAADSSVRQ